MVKIKFDINISNKALYTFVAVAIIIAIAVGVNAYNSDAQGGNPAIFGHSSDELDLTGITATQDNNPQIKISGDDKTYKGIEFRDTSKNTAWQISGSRPNGYGDGDFEIYYNDGTSWSKQLELTSKDESTSELKQGGISFYLPVYRNGEIHTGDKCGHEERGRLVLAEAGDYDNNDFLCYCGLKFALEDSSTKYIWRCGNL